MSVPVSGFTTADIATAAASAGAGGTVLFPNGTYAADDLQNTVADQTWILDRYAVIQRVQTSDTGPVIDNLANGFRFRGGRITDHASNAATHAAIRSDNHSVDVRYVDMHDIKGWGLLAKNADAVFIENKIRDTLYGSIYWYSDETTTRKGPRIEANKCWRDDASKYGSQGGIFVRNTSTGYIEDAKVCGNYVSMANNIGTTAVCIEMIRASGGMLHDNYVYRGRIGISQGDNYFTSMTGNVVKLCHDYAYELGHVTSSLAANNVAYGGGGGVNYGFELNLASTNNLIARNKLMAFSQDYHLSYDSTGNTIV